MMKRKTGFASVILIAAVSAVASYAAAPPISIAPSVVTNGQFLVALARARGSAVSDPAQAAESLRAAGYAVPSLPLDRALTEGSVVAIATSLGLNVSTSSPSAPFTSSQVDAFVRSFGAELGATNPAPGGPIQADGSDPLSKGKGLKKGLTKSRTEPL